MPRWALPDFIEDILPPEAMRVELARRTLIDTCVVKGFALVQPPMLEYVDALTAGTGELDHHIFKVVDQLSGRLLGVRADMTPQAARIDAHLFANTSVNRLCYAGSVLHTQPTALNATREIVQGGAEIYGIADIAGDSEMLSVLQAVLQALQISALHIDLGHSALFSNLAETAKLLPAQREAVRLALQRKDRGALHTQTQDLSLAHLLTLYGDADEVLRRARIALPRSKAITQALSELASLTQSLQQGGAKVTLDLADVPNYDYHSGIVFSAYIPGESVAIARGGRYDNIGKIFGAPKPRPATGFSIDLRLAAAHAVFK